MKKLLLFIPVFFLFLLTTYANDYYIAANGNDNNSGTTQSSPWRSINKLNAYFKNLRPGDKVFFKRGDTFYGNILINQSGNAGSPITIGAYGSGDKPVITGFTTVTSWVNVGNNIWESRDAISPLSYIKMVRINGKNIPMGRWPNSTGPNTGYAVFESHSGKNSITSREMSSSPNWKGAEIVIRKKAYSIDKANITSHNGNVVNFTYTDGGSFDLENGWGYFIQNDIKTLDSENEWFFNSKTNKINVFSRAVPRNVEVSSIDIVVSIKASHIRIADLNINGGNINGIELTGSKNNSVVIDGCTISFIGSDGIYCDQPFATFENNIIENANANGILIVRSDAKIINNIVRNINLYEGMGRVGGNSGIGVSLSANTLIQNNLIDSCGFKGISFSGKGVKVINNFVNTFCFVREDGAGIYTGNTGSAGSIVEGNIVLNGIGALNGTPNAPGANDVTGISIDDYGTGISIINNTIAHMASIGIKLHKANSITVKNNTTFDNGGKSWSKGGIELLYNEKYPVRNTIIENNIFFAKNSNQYSFFASSPSVNDLKLIGKQENNYFAKPIDDDQSIIVNATRFSVTAWNNLIGSGSKSKSAPKKISSTNELRFEYNSGKSSKTIALDANYIDVKGNVYNGILTLNPFSSVVLIRDGAIKNQLPEANAGEDQRINLPINEVQLKGSSNLSEGTGTFLWTKLSGPSSLKLGSPNKEESNVTGLTEGTYKFIFKVSNSSGQSASDTVQVIVISNADGGYLSAVNPGNKENGLDYKYYEEIDIYSVPDFTQLSSVKTGSTSNFDLGVANRADQFLVEFSGFINIAQDDEYTFFTSSDDGSKLFIDNILVVNNDGRHALIEKEGKIGLKAGFHKISVGFFQEKGGKNLKVSYSSNQFGKKAISSSDLYRSVSVDLLAAINPTNITQGIKYKYYEIENLTSVPDFKSLEPVETAFATNFNISEAKRDEQYALSFEGFIEVPSDGVYTFYTSSDDGSVVYIGDLKVVDNDGLHSMKEASGNIGLKAGKHKIQVGYFQQKFNKGLTVEISGPGLTKQSIASDQLFRQISSDLLPGINTGTLVNGLSYKYAESSNLFLLPDFNLIRIDKTGFVSNFNISIGRDTEFAVQFNGYIDIPSDGNYTFYTNSDDGSMLYIDGVQIVNNDGRHGAIEKSGVIGLRAGKHFITVGFFQNGGQKNLKVSYSGPNISKREIPASSLYRVAEGGLLPSINLSELKNGVEYKYYESKSYASVPDFTKEISIKEGKTSNFDLSVANRNTSYAIKFEGIIDVPADGKYIFYTNSDDGSLLYIDGYLIVNNDGLHAARERSGEIGLKAGKHLITVSFFQEGGGKSLDVSFTGPGISKRSIPSSSLFINNISQLGFGQAFASLDAQRNLSENLMKVELKVYPNPFTTSVSIALNGAAGNYNLQMVDVQGRIVMKKVLKKNEGYYQEIINTSSFQRGIYFLRIQHNDESTTIKVEKR